MQKLFKGRNYVRKYNITRDPIGDLKGDPKGDSKGDPKKFMVHCGMRKYYLCSTYIYTYQFIY